MIFKPLLKWVGGKTQLLNIIFQKFPSEINNYYEPFVGAGSVFIELLQKLENEEIKLNGQIIISDTNQDLINLFDIVKNEPQALIDKLSEYTHNYHQAPTIEYPTRFKYDIDLEEPIDEVIQKGKSWLYYYYRALYNYTSFPIESAALIIFLNKTCFRGLYRIGKNGFNSPFGNYKKPSIYSSTQIHELSKLFNKYQIIFACVDYKKALQKVEVGDFVYIDPPYYPIKKTSFVDYQNDGFKEEHKKLAQLCHQMKDKGVKILHSNSYCDFNTENYEGFQIDKLLAKRRINSKNPLDTEYDVLIYN